MTTGGQGGLNRYAGGRTGQHLSVDMKALTLESPLLQLGLRREMIGAAADHLGMVPILECANVMYSNHTGPELLKSQLYHCDSNEVEPFKIFVSCEEVTAETGPPGTGGDRRRTRQRRHGRQVEYEMPRGGVI